MNRATKILRDAWCAISDRCNLDRAEDTPIIQWLKDQEEQANRSTEQIRQRRRSMATGDFLDDEIFNRTQGRRQ